MCTSQPPAPQSERTLAADSPNSERPLRDGNAELDTTPHAELDAHSEIGVASWGVSLMFWLSLVIAAGLYATVALSPRLAEWIRVRDQYAENARRLVKLEENVDYLERVAQALESDPEFARRLAQASLPGTSHEQEIVPVTRELLFGGVDEEQHQVQTSRISTVRPVFTRAVLHFATHRQHRLWMLAAAGALTLVGFTFLNDAASGSLKELGKRSVWLIGLPLRRYQRPAALTPPPAPAAQDPDSHAVADSGEFDDPDEEIRSFDDRSGDST